VDPSVGVLHRKIIYFVPHIRIISNWLAEVNNKRRHYRHRQQRRNEAAPRVTRQV
jgi:hypothetical protein